VFSAFFRRPIHIVILLWEKNDEVSSCFETGILLLRRSPWGYLLASVAVLKGLTMALAVSTIGINMALQGVPDSTAILAPFLVLTLLNLVMAGLLLKNIDVQRADLAPA
jgi:hypothetical protein